MRITNQLLTLILFAILFASPYIKPIHADNANDIEIINPQVQPAKIYVGDNFTISTTLVNNSPNTISIHTSCGGPFSVVFDSHAQVVVKKVCNWMPIQQMLKPGENITESNSFSNLAYTAITPGTANATITFEYAVGNQAGPNLTFADNTTIILKSFLFQISHQTKPTSFPAFHAKGMIVPNDNFAGTVIWTSIHDGKGLVIIQASTGRAIAHFTTSLSSACEASATVCYFTNVTDTTAQAFKVGDTARFSVNVNNKQETISMLTGFLTGLQVTVDLSKIWDANLTQLAK